MVSSSRFVAKVISEIIYTEVQSGTDIMIILDKTSSMEDDLGSIKIGLKQIIESLESQKDIRFSIATYGDRHSDGKRWYSFQNFESDYSRTKDFIENIELTHGGDYPESVYDGVYETFQEGFWDSGSKRIAILIGDAPSLDSSLTMHSSQEIIELATKERINMNFYPIVLSPYDNGFSFGPPKMQNLTFIESVYPNPSQGRCTVRLNQLGTYTLELFNQSGVLVETRQLTQSETSLDLFDQPNGVYILRVSDAAKNFDTRKIILEK